MRAPWGCAWCSSMPGSRRWSWCPHDATGAGHRVAWDRITVVDVFQRFIEHYRIECVCSMELWPVEHRVSVQLSGGF